MRAAVTALVLAAGSSRRLGQPKQLLPFDGRTLLDAVLEIGRAAPFDQRLVTVGGASNDVIETVDFSGYDVVDSVHFTEGCSSSIVSALSHVDPKSAGIVMLLGDQPRIDLDAIEQLIQVAVAGDQTAPLAVCQYDDGIGHPFWFGPQVFDALQTLHGDKAVWKLIESGEFPVTQVQIAGKIPLDVDTWSDYERLLEQNEPAL